MESNFHKRGWLTSPVHQGDHGGAVNTIAQEMPGAPGEPVVNMLVCLSTHLHARLRVHHAPGISCALFFTGGTDDSCTTRAESAPRNVFGCLKIEYARTLGISLNGDGWCSASDCRARPAREYCASRRRDGPWYRRSRRWVR